MPYVGAISPSDYLRPIPQPNLIINGRFDIWQRGTAALSLNASWQYLCDRIGTYLNSTSGTPATATIAQSTDVPSPIQCGQVLNSSNVITIGTGATGVNSTDLLAVNYRMEGCDFASILGLPLTLSFWVKSSVVGVYAVTLMTGNGSYASYVKEFVINNANTWERKIFVFPPFTILNYANTGNYSNGIGLFVNLTLAAGSGYKTQPEVTPVALSSGGNFYAGTNISNTIIQTAGATFNFAALKLEPGVTATPLPPQNFQQELAKCQRYYFAIDVASTTAWPYAAFTNSGVGNAVIVLVPFPVRMRTIPTLYTGPSFNVGHIVSETWQGANSGSATAIAISNPYLNGALLQLSNGSGTWLSTGNAAQLVTWSPSATANDILGFNAEL